MSNVGGIGGSSGVCGVGQFGAVGGMSPDALLQYCQMQMNSLDGQIGDMEKQMQQQTNDEQTVKNLQSQLEQFGSSGPQNPTDMQSAYNAYQQAISSLPQGDPTRGALQQACDQMCKAYQFQPAGTLSAEDQAYLNEDRMIVAQTTDIPNALSDPSGFQDWERKVASSANQIQDLEAKQSTGSLGTKPDSTSWQGTTDAVGSIASDINSNAQMQMLQLQQLASQQQNATELTIQLLQKADSTLLDIAKNA
jgi:hypothetical protein